MKRKAKFALTGLIGASVLAAGLWPYYLPTSVCGTMEGPLPPSCQPFPYFVAVFLAALPFVGISLIAVSLTALSLSVSQTQVTEDVEQSRVRLRNVFGGLLASGSIFLVMFLTIHVLLFTEVTAYYSPPLWVGIMYVPYLVIGTAVLARHHRASGLTLILVGLLAAFAFYPFVNFESPSPSWPLPAIGVAAWVALSVGTGLALRQR
jgi:hypothetical protein